MNLSRFMNTRILSVGILGMPPGLLFVLIMSTMQIWLTEAGLSKTTIGLFAFAAMPNALKFLWAPLIDHIQFPILGKILGRRRSWAIFFQVGLMLSLLGLGLSSPAQNLGNMIFCLTLVSFFGASQEIVLDAYRIEILNPNEYGVGVTSNVLGYRLGTIMGGAGALYIGAFYGWFFAYAGMVFCIFLSSIVILLNPEPSPITSDLMKERQEKALYYMEVRNIQGFFSKIIAWIYGAVIGPFSEFTRRKDWILIVCLILVFRLGDNLINNMANVFYLNVGFTVIEIANVTKFFGVFATIIGGVVGGVLSSHVGFLRGLLIAGILHTLSNIMFIVISQCGAQVDLFYIAIALENVTGGMSTTAFVTYLSSLCHKSFTGTQYALLSALWYLSTNLGAFGGFLADHLDWTTYFEVTLGAAVPGLIILTVLVMREHARNNS
ncbi:MAG: MFS transporter [Proteobacteria bacterium]|nr:MFS transporter [Pseudomonadota bacterium]